MARAARMVMQMDATHESTHCTCNFNSCRLRSRVAGDDDAAGLPAIAAAGTVHESDGEMIATSSPGTSRRTHQ